MSRLDKVVERVGGPLSRTIGNLPTRVQRIIGGAPIVVDGQTLAADLQAIVRIVNAVEDVPIESLPVAKARAQLVNESAVFGGTPLAVDSVEELAIPGPRGPIPARLYRPQAKSGAATPLLVYFHGGGWVLGSLDSHESVCRFLAVHGEVPVLSVDYRLAPEHPFPAGLDDALTAYRYAVDNASTLEIDPAAIGIAGDSAGGNLAAVVAQILAAEPEIAPACQILFNPVTDMSHKRVSYQLFSQGYLLTEAAMDWFKELYLNDPDEALDPRVSPVLATDLSGLPPAYVAVSGFDPLRDEGIDYAERMRAAGVPVTLQIHAGLIHGYASGTGFGRSCREAMFVAVGFLRAHLRSSRSSAVPVRP